MDRESGTPQALAIADALKEWAIATDALEQGKTLMLLRKGGIREPGKTFTVPHTPVLLYPTYEHQKPALLKPEYAQHVSPVPSGWHPTTIRLGAWAQITDVLEISQSAAVEALLPFHVWNEQFVRDRLQWQPRQPLRVLLLRVYRLADPQSIDYHPNYGGCRSWITLNTTISLQGSVPVFTNEDYTNQVVTIRQLVSV